MRLPLILAVCTLAVLTLGQTHTVPGHWTKSGKWVPAKEVKDKEKGLNLGKINRDLVSGFHNKPQRKPEKSKDPYADAQSHLGKHSEHRYYPGHYAKNGKYIPGAWKWVWVKN